MKYAKLLKITVMPCNFDFIKREKEGETDVLLIRGFVHIHVHVDCGRK